jgi:hypothetical protein
MSENHETLAAALAAAQGELPDVSKSKTGEVEGISKTGKPYKYSYTYADLADVAAKIHPVLSKHGLAFTARPLFQEGRYVLLGELLHGSSDQALAGEFPLPNTTKPQDIGSAMTYGRRYLLCALTGVVADADDDGAAAQNAKPERQQRRRREPEPETPLASVPDDGITKPQQAKLHALFNANDLKDRNERLAFTSGLVGRDLASSSELTKDEASRLIDHLEHLAAGELA